MSNNGYDGLDSAHMGLMDRMNIVTWIRKHGLNAYCGGHVEFGESQSRHHTQNPLLETSTPTFGRGKRMKVGVVEAVSQDTGTRVLV